VRFKKLYKKYHAEVEFATIYIREAHPTDRWWLAETKLMRIVGGLFNSYTSYDTKNPVTIEERRQVASSCKQALLGDIPVYVDEMDNKIDLTYVGWPTRVYFVGKDGRIVYDTGIGPYGLNSKELDKKIADYLAQ
jgi:Iodothyronine deiodinase